MIHAVGKGLVIAEIQQSANTTYRVYDYNRRDANRKLRGLHIEKAIEVAQLNLILGKEKRTTKVVKVDTCIVKNI